MTSILGIGNAIVDFHIDIENNEPLRSLNIVPGIPYHAEKMLWNNIKDELGKSTSDGTVPSPFRISAGGSAANTIIGAARLGMKAGFIGKVGDDPYGELYASQLKDYGIDANLFIGSLPTGKAMYIHTRGFKEDDAIVVYRGANRELNPLNILPKMFEGYDYLHVEGFLLHNRVLLGRILSLASDAGCIISMDLSSKSLVTINRSFLSEILKKYVNIAFANENEAAAFAHGVTVERSLDYLSEHCDIAVVKLGDRGSVIRDKFGTYGIAPKPVSDIKSTVGAGDAYAAGFLHTHSLGRSIRECGEAGSAYASVILS